MWCVKCNETIFYTPLTRSRFWTFPGFLWISELGFEGIACPKREGFHWNCRCLVVHHYDMCACENSIVKYVVSFPYFINCIIKNKKHYNTRTDKVMHSNNHWSPTEKARLSSAIANQPPHVAQSANLLRVAASVRALPHTTGQKHGRFRCFAVSACTAGVPTKATPVWQ